MILNYFLRGIISDLFIVVIFKNKEIKSFLQLRSVRLHFLNGYHLIVKLGMLNLPYIFQTRLKDS